MKNISLFMISAVVSVSIDQQASVRATDVTGQESVKEEGKKAKIDIPLSSEAQEIMEDIIDFNKVYKKAEASKSIAPDSAVLDSIKEHSAQYIEDLKKGYEQVERTESHIGRQEIVEGVHQKNNPFLSFYY